MSEQPFREPPAYLTDLDYAAALIEQVQSTDIVRAKLVERGCQPHAADAILKELHRGGATEAERSREAQQASLFPSEAGRNDARAESEVTGTETGTANNENPSVNPVADQRNIWGCFGGTLELFFPVLVVVAVGAVLSIRNGCRNPVPPTEPTSQPSDPRAASKLYLLQVQLEQLRGQERQLQAQLVSVEGKEALSEFINPEQAKHDQEFAKKIEGHVKIPSGPLSPPTKQQLTEKLHGVRKQIQNVEERIKEISKNAEK